jgi:hypothetical protein
VHNVLELGMAGHARSLAVVWSVQIGSAAL